VHELKQKIESKYKGKSLKFFKGLLFRAHKSLRRIKQRRFFVHNYCSDIFRGAELRDQQFDKVDEIKAINQIIKHKENQELCKAIG